MMQPNNAPVRLLLLCSLLTGLGVQSVGNADDQDAIDYRQHVMKTMNAQVEMLSMMIEKKVPADDFATHAQVLAIAAATAKSAFEPEIEGGAAKPEVWTAWDDFAKKMDALVAGTAELAKTAKSGGVAAAAPKMQQTLTCKGCHDTFRVPKK
jgi:cytochrome c556